MTPTPLTLGPLDAQPFSIRRSGVHWLCADGHMCRPGEVVGYCNISVDPGADARAATPPFGEERELQVAFAPRVAGRLRIDADASLGGYLNALGVQPWDPDAVVGRFEPLSPSTEDIGTLRLLMLAGRRMSGLADALSGLLPGWHSRVRGWWSGGPEGPSTLLNLGICDALGPVRGDHSGFLEMFEAVTASAQFVSTPNHPVSPCAPCLLEQFTRSDLDYQAIASDVMRSLAAGAVKATPDDWIFVGALLSALEASPFRDRYDLLTPTGLRTEGPAASILLSLNAEAPLILRHRILGYHLHVQRFYEQAAGPAVRAWLGSAFEPVKRSVDDIKEGYLSLIDLVKKETGGRLLILNRMSTSGQEDISSYAPFDHPMSDTLANVASKELNLMLHDLADARDLSIIDVDAIAADVGGARHLPDGVHQSGVLQSEVRAEIIHAMGFAAVH